MGKKYIMALDQGTTSSRCILFDHEGNICGMAQKELTQIYQQPGWVEQNPREIWSTQLSVLTEALAVTGAMPEDIEGIGITNQRETTIVWNRFTGVPVYNAIVWQCRRTAEQIDRLKEEKFDELIRERTGLIADAYFSASKIAWILDNVEGAREQAEEGNLLFGTVDTWLIWNLTGGAVHVTDYSNASRTMLYDIHKCCWDQEILEKFNIPESMLPEVKPSSYIYGYTDPAVTGGEIPVCGAAGDQQAALFGQSCFGKGEGKITYGTGCFLLMNTGNEPITSKNGLLTTLAASVSDEVEYALEGSVFVAGAAIQWLRDEMRFFSESRDAEYYAGKVKDTGGVYLVPAFTGLGAPHWDMYARGCLIGLTRGTTREHIIRAAQESIAYQVNDLLTAMKRDTGTALSSLSVDGGASRDSFLMQFQSDISDCTIRRPVIRETTALGACYLAGLATGVWHSREELKQLWRCDTLYAPSMDENKRRKLLSGWDKAVGRSLDWAEH